MHTHFGALRNHRTVLPYSIQLTFIDVISDPILNISTSKDNLFEYPLIPNCFSNIHPPTAVKPQIYKSALPKNRFIDILSAD